LLCRPRQKMVLGGGPLLDLLGVGTPLVVLLDQPPIVISQ